MRHVAIVVAKNEERFIGRMLRSLRAQTGPPDLVYVVDDGSTDGTAAIVRQMRADWPALHLVSRPAGIPRTHEDGVVPAFLAAYDRCREMDFTYVSRLDADIEFPPDYFQTLLDHLDANPGWGMAGGVPYEEVGGEARGWRMPAHHVAGALKTMRRRAFDEIGGFVPTYSWDIVDGVAMRAKGWRTGWLPLRVEHLRPHGSYNGVLRGRVKWGEGAWTIGSHPLYALARGAYLMASNRPYGLAGAAFWWGYLRAALRRTPRIAEVEITRALRREQLGRLLRLFRLHRLPV
ncbi:MAG TPA: glycosyltransferase family A protein [Longimicrobium sp.]|nr:glycosyltransferase family A protein [Longimicrobium sp.]